MILCYHFFVREVLLQNIRTSATQRSYSVLESHTSIHVRLQHDFLQHTSQMKTKESVAKARRVTALVPKRAVTQDVTRQRSRAVITALPLTRFFLLDQDVSQTAD